MKKVVITGGSGLLGPTVVEHFVQQGYDVLSVDRQKPADCPCRFLTVDLTNLGECYGALAGADAFVHLAAIPVAYSHPNQVTFRNNVMAAHNMLEAAAGLGIQKAVMASSESIYGLVFAKKKLEPQYVPLDEEHPLLFEDPYALAKLAAEQAGDMFHRRCGMQVVSLRIGNVITPAMYRNFPSFLRDPAQRRMILWSYIDARDIASACRLSIEKDGLGSVVVNLAADETSMDLTNRELMAAEYPGVTDIRVPLDGYETLFSNEKAKRVLGWQPVHRWRDYVPVD